MKRGFTLIELIVAMGILLVLAALTTAGVRSMLEKQREANTRQTIQTVNSLLSERMREVGVHVYPSAWYFNGVYGPHNGSGPGLWIAPSREWDAAQNRYVISPLTVIDTEIPDDTALWTSDLLRDTVIIFNYVGASPNGRKALDLLNAREVVVDIDGTPTRARILVDGWNRPLLFSPAVGVTVDGLTAYQQSTNLPIDATFGTLGGTFPYVFSAGRDGNPSDLQNAIR